jgi:hypothetical protein
MDNRAKEILDEAYATIKRLADLKVVHRGPADDPLLRWSSGMPKPQPAPRPKVMTVTEISQMIAAALEEHDTIWREVIGQFAGAERKRWRDEIAKLKTEFEMRIGALLGEVDKLQRGLSDDRGEVIEMPKFLDRRNAA